MTYVSGMLYVSEEFKALIERHPFPWIAHAESGDSSVGIHDTPPSVFDANYDLIFEMPEELPSKELEQSWNMLDDSHDDFQYMSERDAAIERWSFEEGTRRMQKARNFVNMVNDLYDPTNTMVS